MKKITLIFVAALSLSAVAKAQENTKTSTRNPASQQAANTSGLTPVQKQVQTATDAYNNRTTTQKVVEGFVKGMDRADPGSGSNGAAMGEVVNTITGNNGKPTTTSTPAKTSAQ